MTRARISTKSESLKGSNESLTDCSILAISESLTVSWASRTNKSFMGTAAASFVSMFDMPLSATKEALLMPIGKSCGRKIVVFLRAVEIDFCAVRCWASRTSTVRNTDFLNITLI